MNTTGLFDHDQSLTTITKDRIQSFLPKLWDEVFLMTTSLSTNIAHSNVYNKLYSRSYKNSIDLF